MTTRTDERRTASMAVGAGITHLLRIARTECKSALAFVAASVGGEELVAASPGPGDLVAGAALVDDLVQRLRLDPGIARGKALLRTVHLDAGGLAGQPGRLAVAAVPLRAAEEPPWGFLGVADRDVKAFGFAELERLSPVARRVASYVAARQKVRRQVGAATPLPTDGAAASVPSAPPSVPTMPAPPPAPPTPTPPTPPPTPPPSASTALPGLQSPHFLLDRARRLLGAGARTGSLAVVAIELSGALGPAEEAAIAATRAIRADLRFDDPVARLGETGFLAVVPLAPGGPDAEAVAQRLAASVRTVLGGVGAVRSAHVRADLAASPDVVELVREVRGRLLRDGPGASLAR